MGEIIALPPRWYNQEIPFYPDKCPVVPFSALVERAIAKRGDIVPNAHLAYPDLIAKKGRAKPAR